MTTPTTQIDLTKPKYVESLLAELTNSIFIAMQMHNNPQREAQWERITSILDRADAMRDQLNTQIEAQTDDS